MTVGDLTLKRIKEICEKYRGDFYGTCDRDCPIYHECVEYNFAEVCPCSWMDEELNREVSE